MSEAGAEFLIVGAHALAAHGFARMTKDIDVWVRPSPENAQRVYRALARFGAPVHELSPADFEVPGTVLQIGVEPVRIDVRTEIDGVAFDDAWRGRMESTYGDVAVPVLSRAHLIQNKKASARPQDFVDVARLEAGDEG